MNNTMIGTRRMATLLSGAYVFFAIQSIRGAAHQNEIGVLAPMPVVRAITYCFCVYFFVEIQRGKPNLLEKAIAFASGGVFVAKLTSLICAALDVNTAVLSAIAWIATALLVLATIGLIARTIQIFRSPNAFQSNMQQ